MFDKIMHIMSAVSNACIQERYLSWFWAQKKTDHLDFLAHCLSKIIKSWRDDSLYWALLIQTHVGDIGVMPTSQLCQNC